MTFTSVEFALFAAGVLLLYYGLPRRWQWMVLLGSSWVFYLWAGLRYGVFLLFSIASTYIAALRIQHGRTQTDAAGEEDKRILSRMLREKNRQILLLFLGENLGILLLCKACLTAPVAAAVAGTGLSFLSLGLPMGISFYLFQSIGYVVDVYRGKVEAEKNPFRLALFLSYFPQLIQGPISKWQTLSRQLFVPHDFDKQQCAFGAQRMLWGYLKKLVIADRVAPAVAALHGAQGSGAEFFLLTLLYALQIYGDFTGGIDVALGFSQMLGITLPDNFVRPFFSRSVAQFWRRWHISLGEWMKEYIFFPVSASAIFRRLGKFSRRRLGSFGKRLPVHAASAVTWLVTGLWHGLTPNFLLWGMLNWAVMLISGELEPVYQAFHRRFGLNRRRWYPAFEMLRTFFLMNLIRSCDLYADVGVYLGRIASLAAPGTLNTPLPLTGADWAVLALGSALMLGVSLYQQRRGSIRVMLWQRPVLRGILLPLLVLAILLLGCYGVGYDSVNFIYNQF